MHLINEENRTNKSDFCLNRNQYFLLTELYSVTISSNLAGRFFILFCIKLQIIALAIVLQIQINTEYTK